MFLGGCWFTAFAKDSRHAGCFWEAVGLLPSPRIQGMLEVFGRLLVYCLRQGFKVCWMFLGGCWFIAFAKDSRHAGCWFTAFAKDSRHAGCFWEAVGLLPSPRIQGMLDVFGRLLVYCLHQGFKACWKFWGGCWFTTFSKDSRHAGSFWEAVGLLPSPRIQGMLEVFGRLLVYCLHQGFKACWKFLGGCWFTAFTKDSRHAGSFWEAVGLLPSPRIQGMLEVFGRLLVYCLHQGFKACWKFLGGCWFTAFTKDSRHAGSFWEAVGLLPSLRIQGMLEVFGRLLVYCLHQGFKACWKFWGGCWFIAFAKDSMHAGSFWEAVGLLPSPRIQGILEVFGRLLVYCLRQGFKACWKFLGGCWFTAFTKDSRHAGSFWEAVGLLPSPRIQGMLEVFGRLLVYCLHQGFKACWKFLGGCWFTAFTKDSRHAGSFWEAVGLLPLPRIQGMLEVFGRLLVYCLLQGFKAFWKFLGGCWFTAFAKDSRHAGSFGEAVGLLPSPRIQGMLDVFGRLLVYCLRQGFKACWKFWGGCWFIAFAKDSRHAGCFWEAVGLLSSPRIQGMLDVFGRLLVYCLHQGFKACWMFLGGCWFTVFTKDSRHAGCFWEAVGLLSSPRIQGMLDVFGRLLVYCLHQGFKACWMFWGGCWFTVFTKDSRHAGCFWETVGLLPSPRIQGMLEVFGKLLVYCLHQGFRHAKLLKRPY